jgi:hypothetical protein
MLLGSVGVLPNLYRLFNRCGLLDAWQYDVPASFTLDRLDILLRYTTRHIVFNVTTIIRIDRFTYLQQGLTFRYKRVTILMIFANQREGVFR